MRRGDFRDAGLFMLAVLLFGWICFGFSYWLIYGRH